MATEFISNSWLMPENSNQDKLANYSLTFDGTDETISILDLPDFGGGSLTISFWIKSGVDSSNAYVLMRSGFSFFIFQNGTNASLRYRLNTSATNQLDGGTTLDNNWHHCVMTFDSSANEFKIFEDGSQVGTTTTTSGALASSTATVYLASFENSSNFKSGNLTEVSFFDYALSSSQVTQLYGTGSAIGNPMAITNGRKPVAYYPLSNAGFNGEFLASNGAEQDYVFNFVPNDYIDCGTGLGDTLGTVTNLSISTWVKAPSTAINDFTFNIGSFSNSYGAINFNIHSNKLTVRLNNDAGRFSLNPFTSTDWNNVVFVYDGSSQSNSKLYINGQLQTTVFSGSFPSTLNLSGLKTILGAGYSASFSFNGLISNTAVFNTSLPATGTESVESLYNNGTPPNIASYSGLQGWWELDASATFDGSNWSIPDASSNSNTGTSSGMTVANLVQSDLIINAPFDSFALELDGSDDFINCGNAFTQTGAFSVSAWIKTSTTGATSVLYKSGVFQFGKDSWYNGGVANAPNLSLTDSGGITKLFRNGVAPSGATVTVKTVVDLKDGNWHHIAFTYNGTNQGKYYTDGVVSYTYDITDGSWAGTLASNSNDLLIGKTTVANWNGNVSNISIYSSELTSAQVTTLYNEGKPFDLNTFAVTPVSWWRLGSVNSSYNSTTSEWTILDEIGTSNGTGSNLGPAQTALVDGIGATGSGTSSGMSSGTNKTGDAPYSNSNALSYNMSVTAKSTSVPT